MKRWIYPLIVAVIVVAFLPGPLAAASLVEKRPYEPVVLPAYNSAVRHIEGARVDQIYLYAWSEATQEWRLMPFQIDEQTLGPNPLNPSVNKWFYFIPPEWSEVDSINISGHNGIFDDHDELVFMVADCGDKAPDNAMLEADGETLRPKLELMLRDTLETDKTAYAYVFLSAIKKEIPRPYEIQYDEAEDRITTKYYRLGLSEHGGVDEIAIQPPGGNGADLLDQLKIRFSGILDFAFPIYVLIKENDFYLFPEIEVTPDPVVRLIRESHITLSLGDYLVEELAFPVVSKFYPYNGFVKGGTSLAPEDLFFYYDSTAVQMIVNDMRESWDYNENAVGMMFYNKYNDGILIDGHPDAIDDRVDVPINAWDLTTGDQGSLFKIAHFKEQKWDSVKAYYWDNENGGQADSTEFDYSGNPDTGDSVSYGDNGILFFNNEDQDSVTIELNYQIYFIPEKNLTKQWGETFADIVNSPVEVSRNVISEVDENATQPMDFALLGNYPNPFNGSTFIRFATPQRSQVRLEVFDVRGRLVTTLADRVYNAATHQVAWDGTNSAGQIMPSGIYYCRMQSGDFMQTLKLLMIK